MITLCTNMVQYYVQTEGIPQFIVMMEDAQKKAKRVGMPIANVKLVMILEGVESGIPSDPHQMPVPTTSVRER